MQTKVKIKFDKHLRDRWFWIVAHAYQEDNLTNEHWDKLFDALYSGAYAKSITITVEHDGPEDSNIQRINHTEEFESPTKGKY